MQPKFEKPTGSEPVYFQLVRQVKAHIASGKLKLGDSLPSRRELAAELEINPNTVQKAYKLLEDDGIITTERSSHSVITIDSASTERLRISEAKLAAKEFTSRMKELGFELETSVRILNDTWQT